jgi:hypothetical protein
MLFNILFYLIVKPFLLLKDFLVFFYINFIPFIVTYFGIPLFILGVLLCLAFTGSTLFLVVIFFIFLYYFIKGTVLRNPVA